MRRIFSVLVIATIALAPRVAAHAAVLDAGFGGDGIVTAFASGAVATAVNIDGRHRIVAVGYTLERHPDVVVARFLPNGTPDTSFGVDGRARFDIGGADYAFDAAMTPRGGIAITGRRTAKQDRIFVLRLRPNGNRLRTFGNDGQVLIDAGTASQSADAIAFTPKGRLVLGGYRSAAAATDSLLVRVSPTGAPDPSFGRDGIAVYRLGDGSEQINDLLVLPGGSIVAAGEAERGQVPRFSVLRARSDGRLDTSFGRSGGYTLLDIATGADTANALTTAPDGDYLIAGSSAGDWAIAAVTPDGRRDLAFSTDGRRVLPGDATFEQATDIVSAAAGLYVLGTVHGRTDDLGVALLRPNGRLSTAFDGSGRYELDVAGTRDAGAAAVLQPNGKLVAAGQTWRAGQPRFLLVRLRVP